LPHLIILRVVFNEIDVVSRCNNHALFGNKDSLV
jgi:hypothetical protein